MTWMGKSTELGMSFCSPKTRIVLVGIRGRHKHGWKTAESGSHVKEIVEKCGSGRTNFTTKIWDALNVNVNRTKTLSM